MSFQDIKGQDKPIEILKEQIKSTSLFNGYLFAGPQGIGKKKLALTLAKALNCEEGSLDSCDHCPSCLKIENGNHPDIFLVDADSAQEESESESSAIKIESIRQLQKDISLRPYEGKRKVFIIDNAHNLTAEASNALLKILEEPPLASIIILITAKPNLLFKTIISRCKVIKFYPLSRSKLEGILSGEYGVTADFAHYLAYFCEGRLGLALTLKQKDMLVEKNRVIDMLVLSRQLKLEDFPSLGRPEVRGYLNILAGWFRDMYLMKIGVSGAELINLDRKSELSIGAEEFSFTALEEIMGQVSSAILYLEQNVNTRLLLSNLKEEIIYRIKPSA